MADIRVLINRAIVMRAGTSCRLNSLLNGTAGSSLFINSMHLTIYNYTNQSMCLRTQIHKGYTTKINRNNKSTNMIPTYMIAKFGAQNRAA